jgi:predicted deacylase
VADGRTIREIPVGRRIDGAPWSLRVIEHSRSSPGPTTAVVAGVYGDKPMSCLAAHAVDRILAQASDLAGTVVLVPAANQPALEAGTRINPDHLPLNRRFPGSPKGFLTDQIAHALIDDLVDRVDCVLDLHSGTPTMALWYTYDFGDLGLSSSFGYLPVIEGHQSPGQLGTVAAERGVPALLAEWGGGSIDSLEVGVEGTLNVLRHRGHLGGSATGPARLPVINDRRLMLASTPGAFESTLATGVVGSPIEPGVVGWVTNVVTGEKMEEFVVEDEGALLLMTVTAPAMVRPGDFVFMIGYPDREVAVPNHRDE